LNKLKINLIGTGIEIKRILLPVEVLEHWKRLINPGKTITEALLDPFFYYKLKDKKYTSLEDLPADKCSGILNVPKSQIEIWLNRKKISKLSTHELFNESVLFPLFNIEKVPLPFVEKKGIYIHQNEIGTIGTYELIVESKNLNIDDFLFEIDHFQNVTFIKNIKYKSQDLILVKKDTLITYQSGYEVY